MNALVNRCVNHLPFTSNIYSHAAAGLVVASAAALYYSSPWASLAAALGALVSFAIKKVKQVLEEREASRIAGEIQSQKLIRLAAQCVKFDANGYSVETKEKMISLLNVLSNEKQSVQEGGDMRPTIVGLQQIFEHVIKVFRLIDDVGFQGTIHTPQPPTPLCAEVNAEDLSSLMAPSLLSNINSLLTVKGRTVTLRALLNMPDTKLYAVYSRGGLEKRTEKDQEVFKREVALHPDSLIPIELPVEIGPDFLGATYILTTPAGACAFCVDAPQINQTVVEKWGIYCGSLEDSRINFRINRVFDHILSVGGPDIRAMIAKETGTVIRVI